MKPKLDVRTIDETEYDAWSRLVAGSPSGSIFALPAYLDILCGATNGRYSILGVFQGDELVGGMPLFFRRVRLGEIMARRPLLAYLGPVLRDYATAVPSARTSRQLAILTALETALRQVSCLHMVLHVRHPITDVRVFQAAGWQVEPEYSYVVDISDLTATWRRLSHNLRRLVSRAESLGIVVTEDDDFDSFYRLHREVHTRKGSPLYLPKAAFRDFVRRVLSSGLGSLYQARLPDGLAVSTQLVLTGPHPVSHTVCAGSDASHLAKGATPFLRWHVFRSLAASGGTANDLTGAPYPHDVTRFKAQLGGDLVTTWLLTRPLTTRYRLRRWGDPLVRLVRPWLGR